MEVKQFNELKVYGKHNHWVYVKIHEIIVHYVFILFILTCKHMEECPSI